MGGKARTAFQIVLWGAALWASGGSAAAAGVPSWLGPTLGVASTVYGSWAAKEARRKAENAAAAATGADRRATLRSGVASKYYVYGTAWVPSVICHHREPVSKEDPYFWLVLALPVAHEIHGFGQIYFGDVGLLPLDGNGDTTASQYARVFTNSFVATGIIPSDGSGYVDLPGDPADNAADILRVLGPMEGVALTVTIQDIWAMPPHNPDTYQDVIKPEVTVRLVPNTRNRVVIEGAAAGDHYTINYTYQYTRSYIRIMAYNGTPDQVANQPLIDATVNQPAGVRWTSTDRLRGIPYVVIRMHVNEDVFPQGLENFSFLIHGSNQVFDTRNGITGYTLNPILAARDYAVKECDVLTAQIDQALNAAEAWICDEPVPLPPGQPNEHPGYTNSSPHALRYSCNIALSTESTPQENLGLILSTCDGTAVPSGSTFDIRCGHYDPPVMALTDSDFASAPTVIRGLSRPDLFNQARARFTNWQKPFWPLDDSPPFESEVYMEQDGRYIVREFDLVGVISPYVAHRLIKQFTHRARAGMRVRAVFNVRSFRLSPEITVLLSSRSLGIVDKVFRIKTYKPVALDLVEIDMQEDAPELFQWEYTESHTFDPAPNTSLPRVGIVPAMEGLTARTDVDVAAFGPSGEVTPQCLVQWSAVSNMLVLNGGHIEIRHKRTQDVAWNNSPFLVPTATSYRFSCRRGDLLLIEGRLANAVARGPWKQIIKLADDTPTEHISGNLLYNASFEFIGMYDVDPTPDWYYYKGWIGDNNGVAGFVNPTQNPLLPFRPMVGITPTLADPMHTGVVMWYDTQATSGDRITFIRSTHMGVTPGDRVVAFVWGWMQHSRSYIGIEFWNADGDFVGLAGYSPDIPQPTSYPMRVEDMKVTHIFGTVPPSAVTATLILVNQRIAATAGTNYPLCAWWKPYFGRASEGQVTLPNWTKI